MPDIFDMPLIDIVKEKIKRKEKELMILQQQLTLLSSSPTPMTNTQLFLSSKDINTHLNGNNTSIKKEANETEQNITKEFKFPSQSELREMIFGYIKNNNEKLVKTSDFIKYYYPYVDKDNKLDLTKRFSVTLNLLKNDRKIFSMKKKGEKGDLYTTNKEVIEREKNLLLIN